jgi:hypothetical protein
MKKMFDANYAYAPTSFESWKRDMTNAGFSADGFDSDSKFYGGVYALTSTRNKHMPNKKGKYKNFYDWWYGPVQKEGRFGWPGYKEGGMVDYTGLAMVHGSSSKPEAFLNASQTEMFATLSDALAKISIGSGNSESFVIENITIQTNQLNNKQDFNAAGKTLAEAFSSAISRRGIAVNTKR